MGVKLGTNINSASIKGRHLGHLTEPPDLVEADEGAAEDHEGFGDVGTPLVADGGATDAVEPGQCALDDPAVPARAFAAVHPTPGDAGPGDAGPDGAGAALSSAATVVIGLVGVELVGPPPGTTSAVPHAGHSVQGGRPHQAVMPVGRVQADPERRASPIDHKVALRARFGPRSVGVGPVSAPPVWLPRMPCPDGLGSSPGARRPRDAQAARDEVRPRRQPPASRATGASRSCRSPPSHAAASPRVCPSAEQR